MGAPESPIAASYQEAARAISMQLAFSLSPRENGSKHIKGDPIGIMGN